MRQLPPLEGGRVVDGGGSSTFRVLAGCPECSNRAILSKNLAEPERHIPINCPCGRMWVVVMRDMQRGGELFQVIEWLPNNNPTMN